MPQGVHRQGERPMLPQTGKDENLYHGATLHTALVRDDGQSNDGLAQKHPLPGMLCATEYPRNTNPAFSKEEVLHLVYEPRYSDTQAAGYLTNHIHLPYSPFSLLEPQRKHPGSDPMEEGFH